MAQLTIKHVRQNQYTHAEEEVPKGTAFGFWRIVEHTAAGWFPWPALYHTRKAASEALERCTID